MITHIEPDILECEVKWALRSITRVKASGGTGIPVEPIQILKDDAVKVLQSIYQQIWKTQQWPQDWKGQFSFQSQRKATPKNIQTITQLHSSHTLASSVQFSRSVMSNSFFIVQISHPFMTTGKTIALTRWIFVGKVMSLLFNMLSRLVITFLSRRKHLLISWLQSPSAVILEPPKIKSANVSTVSPSICHEVMGPDAMIFIF